MEINSSKYCPLGCFTIEEWPKGARVAICEHPTLHPEEKRRVIDYNSTGKSEFARILRPRWCKRTIPQSASCGEATTPQALRASSPDKGSQEAEEGGGCDGA